MSAGEWVDYVTSRCNSLCTLSYRTTELQLVSTHRYSLSYAIPYAPTRGQQAILRVPSQASPVYSSTCQSCVSAPSSGPSSPRGCSQVCTQPFPPRYSKRCWHIAVRRGGLGGGRTRVVAALRAHARVGRIRRRRAFRRARRASRSGDGARRRTRVAAL